jgi:lipopolysaccharide transport system ATP-binding protein
MTAAITVNNLSKKYRIGKRELKSDTLLGECFRFIKTPLYNFRRIRSLTNFNNNELNQTSDIIWALKDINFEVKQGEVVGIIGKNGAGKSTLLKILSRITYPSDGFIKIRGSISSLLEVGTGFHQELTVCLKKK